MAAGQSKEGDYGEVLLQIVQRLIATIKEANESTCYLSLDPDTLPNNPGDTVFVVAPLSGTFREGAFVGGGVAFLAVHSGCIVKIHCPTLIDQDHRDATAITDESLGLIRHASKVISSLSPSSLEAPSYEGWTPKGQTYLLTSPLRPVGYSLHKSENAAIRSIELTFAFEFDWDTTKQ